LLHASCLLHRKVSLLSLFNIKHVQVWHAVSQDRVPLRKQYLEAIVPPLVAVLRRWRPLLSGIYEFATQDGLNPLAVDDPALDADATPIEVELVSLSSLLLFHWTTNFNYLFLCPAIFS